jgi:Insertion element 4 transposase N-terminal
VGEHRSGEVFDPVAPKTRPHNTSRWKLSCPLAVLAMGLFRAGDMRTVWQKLAAGLTGLPFVARAEKALRDLHRRLGPAPVTRELAVRT